VRRIATAALGLVLGLSTLATFAHPASADTPDCASKREFTRIDAGMSLARVTKILDISGSRTGTTKGPSYKDTSRLYRKCGTLPALASIDYRKPLSGGVWRVTSKSWS